jgi:drug/metabolite transporter (DMT)-like permease
MKTRVFWIVVAFAYAIFSAPHATAIKVAVDSVDPILWVLVRFAPVALVCTPFVIAARRKLLQGMAWKYSLGSGIGMVTALLCFTWAIELSQASYASILTLATPITLVALSWVILKTKITTRSATGITLAALGAMVMVILPVALSGGSTAFYPLATVLVLVNSVSFSLALIWMRRANEQYGVPLMAGVGVNAYIATFVCGVLLYASGNTLQLPTELNFWLLAVYSSLGIALLGRMLSIRVFENLGPAFNAGLLYFEVFLAVLIPVFVLGERISLTMVIGGILILSGLYMIEHHKRAHANHHLFWRHHH